MEESNEHERMVEILKRVRRPAEAVTEDSLEENLRWLLQVTVPEEQAPATLRQRVQGLTTRPAASPQSAAIAGARPEGEATAAPPDPAASGFRWPRLRYRWTAPPVRWRLLLGAVPLAAASVALFLLLAGPAPAGVLDRTLQAMAKVRSAHCTGWLVNYSDKDSDGQPIPGRMTVKWWYRAPDRYRKVMGPKVPGWSREPGTLIVQGERARFIGTYSQAVRNQQLKLSPAQLARWLSPLDFFSRTGLLERARREKDAQVSIEEGVHQARPIKKITVVMAAPEGDGTFLQRWVLFVDPQTERIVRSEVRRDWQGEDGTWERTDEEILDHFDYDVEVPASLVSVAAAAAPPALAKEDLSPRRKAP